MSLAALPLETDQQPPAPAGMPARPAAPNRAFQKLENAARDFEGILLASLWRAWNQSNPFGDSPEEIGSSMTDMSMEMAAMAIARKGGIGLAKIIVDSLKKDVVGQEGKSG